MLERGHFLTMDSKVKNPPSIFIQVSKKRDKIVCSTEDLLRLNQRNNDSLNEISLLSDMVLDQLLHEVKKKVFKFYSSNLPKKKDSTKFGFYL